jgi:hypothetical protein
VNTHIPAAVLLGRVASVPEVEFHLGLAVSFVVVELGRAYLYLLSSVFEKLIVTLESV